jgi:hypothetical protein
MRLTYAQLRERQEAEVAAYLRKMIRETRGRNAAAQAAGCNRTHFADLCRRHGIEPGVSTRWSRPCAQQAAVSP